MVWTADWVFVCVLTLTGAPSHRGLSSHGQICLNLLWNNSVDLFYCETMPQGVRECRAACVPDLHFISLPARLFFFFSCSFYMQKSLSLSFSNLPFSSHQPPLLQWRSDFWQVCRRNSLLLNPFIFIHTNTGLESLAAPQTKPEWPFDWQLSPFHPNTNEIHKHTSNWLKSPGLQQWRRSGGTLVDLQTERCGGRSDYSQADLSNEYTASLTAPSKANLACSGRIWAKIGYLYDFVGGPAV